MKQAAPSEPDLATIADAFSRTAEHYDNFADDHPHLTRMREQVYAHVVRHVPAGASILELNAGTGTDAVALARRGYRVHATDIAAGMLERVYGANPGDETVKMYRPGATFGRTYTPLASDCAPDVWFVSRLRSETAAAETRLPLGSYSDPFS